jgi:hypothetical protein
MTKAGPPKRLLIGEIRDYKPMNNFDGESYNELKAEMEKAIPRKVVRYDQFMYLKSCIWVICFLIAFTRWIYYSRVIDLFIYILVAG